MLGLPSEDSFSIADFNHTYSNPFFIASAGCPTANVSQHPERTTQEREEILNVHPEWPERPDRSSRSPRHHSKREKEQCELSSWAERAREGWAPMAPWRASALVRMQGAWVWKRKLEAALREKRWRAKEKHSRTTPAASPTASCGSVVETSVSTWTRTGGRDAYAVSIVGGIGQGLARAHDHSGFLVDATVAG